MRRKDEFRKNTVSVRRTAPRHCFMRIYFHKRQSRKGARRFLDASNNVIDNMAPLSNLENLNSLNLSNNKITTTVPIVFSEDSSYVTLDFSHNEITTLYISSNVSYRYLAFYGNPILNVPGLGELKGSEIVFEYSPDINFEILGKSSFISYQVFDCPLDCQIRIGEMLGTYRTTFTNEEEYLKSKVEK